jgi:hypothetical protein
VSRETRTCRHELDPRGFVRATVFEGADMDLADARDNVAATFEVGGRRRTPVLVDLRGVRSQTRECRKYFVGPEATAMTGPVALLVGSPVSRVIGNFFLRLNDQRVPTRLFSDEGEAAAWLLAQRG